MDEELDDEEELEGEGEEEEEPDKRYWIGSLVGWFSFLYS